jgi:hypothetical protein
MLIMEKPERLILAHIKGEFYSPPGTGSCDVLPENAERHGGEGGIGAQLA